MIITRTPLRIPIGGGGTDLPEFYKKYGSFFISAAIDYYVYVAVKRRPVKGIRLGYSHTEEVQNVVDIAHPIIKSTLKYLKIPTKRGIEIVSMGDLPAGTGLGSSGSFTVGLLNALQSLEKKPTYPKILAEQACHVNMDILKEPSGKQDEYIASYGGIMCFEIDKKGAVKSYPLKISEETINNLQNNLLMFYTGITRQSKKVLTKQNEKTASKDKQIIDNLIQTQKIGFEIKKALEKGNVLQFAKLLDQHWFVKRKRASTSSSKIDRWYNIAKAHGALGGKIMGAGGGGFFIFYCNNEKEKLRSALAKEGLEEVRFRFDFEGTRLLINI